LELRLIQLSVIKLRALYLVTFEFSAVDGSSLWFQSNQDMSRIIGTADTGLQKIVSVRDYFEDYQTLNMGPIVKKF
jgi:hypothetical protein